MHEVGDIYMEETDLIETIGKIVSGFEISSVMVTIPSDVVEAYVENTGNETPPDDLDMLSITMKLANGKTQSSLMLIDQVKELLMVLLEWHDDMHKAGKCGHRDN